jgi:DNA (cytosine-5)-methyltransferase 1
MVNVTMTPPYTFVDLFAGIGGFHVAFHSVGAKCVFVSEWDEQARMTYEYNFKKYEPELFDEGLFAKSDSRFARDITRVDESRMPDFDILCAGFP